MKRKRHEEAKVFHILTGDQLDLALDLGRVTVKQTMADYPDEPAAVFFLRSRLYAGCFVARTAAGQDTMRKTIEARIHGRSTFGHDELCRRARLAMTQHAAEHGLFRIAPAEQLDLGTFAEHRRLSDIPADYTTPSEQVAHLFLTSPRDWFFLYRDFPCSEWGTVEQWNAGTWETIQLSRTEEGRWNK